MKASEIAKIAQIASALEVSGYPKPGNVHRTRDYDDMVFEDFVISGIVIGIHSGKHAIIKKMEELNLEEYLDNIDEIVIKIKEYLETNKTIDDDNIRKIIIGNVKVKRK